MQLASILSLLSDLRSQMSQPRRRTSDTGSRLDTMMATLQVSMAMLAAHDQA